MFLSVKFIYIVIIITVITFTIKLIDVFSFSELPAEEGKH